MRINTGGIPVFHDCYVDPVVPDNLLGRIRSCSGKDTIGDCPKEFEDNRTRQLCHSYTAMVFEPNAAYRKESQL